MAADRLSQRKVIKVGIWNSSQYFLFLSTEVGYSPHIPKLQTSLTATVSSKISLSVAI